MISEIKKYIKEIKGKKVKLKIDVGRNKEEAYIGVIGDAYSNIWTFKTGSLVKSFSYSDILTRQVIISSL